jgi:hypothetical protein
MSRAGAILREPIVHFLIVGAALFLFYELTNDAADASRNRIVVDVGQVEQIAAQFSRTWLRPPTEEELDRLIEGHIREEVFYREALAMGLDQDDPVVRQRLRLKLEFLLEDLAEMTPPEDAVLQTFLRENADRFRREPEITFRQVYLNLDRHDDLDAIVRETLERLDAGVSPEMLGDSAMIPVSFEAATPTEIARNFGQEFAREVSAVTVGSWQGPIFSGLGAHLVEVSHKSEARLPDLAEIRPVVEREWLAQRREALDETAYRQLRDGYDVVVEPFDPALAIAAGSKAGRAQ